MGEIELATDVILEATAVVRTDVAGWSVSKGQPGAIERRGEVEWGTLEAERTVKAVYIRTLTSMRLLKK